MKTRKKVKIFIIAFFVLLFVAFIAYISYLKNKPININYSNNLTIKFNNLDVIEIENKLPISDVLGKKLTGNGTAEGIQGYVEFSVTNNTPKKVSFDIFLVEQNVYDKKIKSNYIKLYLTDFDDKPYEGFENNIIPTFDKLPFLNDYISSKGLYSSSLKANETKKFRLRVWLSDSYVVSKNVEYFGFDIDVKSK